MTSTRKARPQTRAPAWTALSAARATKRPFITTYHGAYNENGPLKRAYNSVMARGDVVIANSDYTASLVQSRYGTPKDRIRVIHRGVDQATFDRTKIAAMIVAMADGTFGWVQASLQPVILGPGGEVLSGHHRVVASYLAGVNLTKVAGPRPQVQRLPQSFRPEYLWIDVLPDVT